MLPEKYGAVLAGTHPGFTFLNDIVPLSLNPSCASQISLNAKSNEIKL